MMEKSMPNIEKFTTELLEFTSRVVASNNIQYILDEFFQFATTHLGTNVLHVMLKADHSLITIYSTGNEENMEELIFQLKGTREIVEDRKIRNVFGYTTLNISDSYLICFKNPDQEKISEKLFHSTLDLLVRKLEYVDQMLRRQENEQNLEETNHHLQLILQFVNNLDQSIQVANSHGRIVYLNEIAKKRLGIYDFNQRDYYVSDFEPLFKTQEDWLKHVLELREKKKMIIRSYNTIQGTKESIPVEVIITHAEINGTEYVIALSRDISQIQEYESLLKKREQMLKVISDVTYKLLDSNDIIGEIRDTLLDLGQAVKVDRTYLFTNAELPGDVMRTSQRCEWNSGTKTAQIDNPDLQNLPISIFDGFLENLINNKPFQSITSAMPESDLKELLDSQDITSILIIPIFDGEFFWGFIGYDDCTYERTWDESEVTILQTFANVISKSLERKRNIEQIETYAQFSSENPEPVFRIDKSGKIVLRNEPSKRIHQVRIEGTSINDSFDLSSFCRKIIDDVSSDQRMKNYHVVDQEEFHYSVTAKLLSDKESVNVYMNDITTLVSTTKKLNDANQLIDNILLNLEDTIWSIRLPQYEVVFLSDSAERVSGVSREEFMQDFRAWTKSLLPEDKWVVEQLNKDLLDKGESNIEHRIKRKDNSVGWVSNRCKIITDSKGIPIRIDGSISDITERKNYEATIQFQQEKFRNLIENMNLGLMEVDLNGKILYVNDSFEKMSGYQQDQMIDKSAEDLFLMDQTDPIIKEKLELRSKNQSDSYEVRVKNVFGEKRWWLISGAPNYDSSGKLIGSIGIHLDITNQKKVEKELITSKLKAEASEKSKENFLASMSHEIRTPLNGIIGLANQLIHRELPLEDAELVKLIHTSGKHLLSLINQILELSKITSGKIELNNRTFDIFKTLSDVELITRPLVEEKLLEFELDIDPTISKYYIGDDVRLKQVLLNLVSNSIKYTEQGSISLKVERIESGSSAHVLRFKIKDTGIGMSEEFLQKIFQKFTQENVSNERSSEGIGLGMAITKEIIELFDGKINVESEKEVGTTVTIDIQLQTSTETQPDSISTNDETYSEKGLRILVAEDNEINRLVIKMTLEKLGNEYIEAKNGKEAVELAQTTDPDLIFMDIHMPVLDGIKATGILRNELHYTKPIYAVTADIITRGNQSYEEIGFNGVLIKPFEEVDLKRILKSGSAEKQSKGPEKNKQEPEQLFNLNTILELSQDDPSYQNTLIDMMIEHFPVMTDDLELALQNNEPEQIGFICHKFKPNVSILSIKRIENEIKLLADIKSGEMTPLDLKEKTTKVIHTMREVINGLREFRKNN